MKVYKLQPGVVLTEVCGEYLLVATKKAQGTCPYVTRINRQAAEYWRIVEQESVPARILDRAAEKFGKERHEVLVPFLAFVKKMSQSGYLLTEETE